MPYHTGRVGPQSPATYPPAARIQRKLRHQPGFSMPMTSNPNALRAIVFIDGQNLYGLAKAAWGNYGHPYNLPCYDARLLAENLVGRAEGRRLSEVRFYTGVMSEAQSPFWAKFWRNKIYAMRQQGVYVYEGRIVGGQEKGVDVSIATDLLWLIYKRLLDVAIIVSQDSDFVSAVQVGKRLANDQGRHVRFESAYPEVPARADKPYRSRGVDGTNWVVIDKATYDACLDPADYR